LTTEQTAPAGKQGKEDVENTGENSIIEFRGEIPLPCGTNASDDRSKSEAARGIILHCAATPASVDGYRAW
jgi:hypothetical protein